MLDVFEEFQKIGNTLKNLRKTFIRVACYTKPMNISFDLN